MEQPTLLSDSPTSAPTTTQLIESILFIASEPVTIGQLAKALEIVPDAVEAALDELQAALHGRGIRVQRVDDRAQLVSAPESAAAIERFLGMHANTRLSAAALEVLGIIAYRQPITRAQIEAVRGVDCGGVLRALLSRELICEAGRLEAVGRPILYATTAGFLQQFGLTSLRELPPIDVPDVQEQH